MRALSRPFHAGPISTAYAILFGWHDLLMAPPLDRSCQQLARDVVALRRPAVIAVDGVDGSGKTTVAGRLAGAIEAAGRPAVIVHEDDFLAPRETRYRLGRDSPEGFFRDSYDLGALIEHVLDPLRPGGDRRVRRRIFDHRTDTPIDASVEEMPVDIVIIVEGMFLHRDELVDRWDWSVFLDVPFAETARRMALRDGTHPDPEHPTMRRYVEGQRIYLATCRPRGRATVVMDNTSPVPSEGRSIR
jgi:uridine kinase